MVKAGMLTMTGKDKIDVSNLPKINPLKLHKTLDQLIGAINSIPDVPAAYSERWENR